MVNAPASATKRFRNAQNIMTLPVEFLLDLWIPYSLVHPTTDRREYVIHRCLPYGSQAAKKSTWSNRVQSRGPRIPERQKFKSGTSLPLLDDDDNKTTMMWHCVIVA
jgi:hypothetical protein